MSIWESSEGSENKHLEALKVENPTEVVKEKIEKSKKDEQIEELGSLLHDEWRASRKKEDGTFESRERNTKDEIWIKEHGVDKVDIANTDYKSLPEDWKGENKKSAEVAVEEIYKAIDGGLSLDNSFVESASNVIHEKWLERNGSWAPEDQKKPYNELSEEEKEKDRVIIRKAIVVYEGPEKKKNDEDAEKLKNIRESLAKM